jgi:hypothetical protein
MKESIYIGYIFSISRDGEASIKTAKDGMQSFAFKGSNFLQILAQCIKADTRVVVTIKDKWLVQLAKYEPMTLGDSEDE